MSFSPALTALLPNATREMAGDEGPALCAVLTYEVRHLGVLLTRASKQHGMVDKDYENAHGYPIFSISAVYFRRGGGHCDVVACC